MRIGCPARAVLVAALLLALPNSGTSLAADPASIPAASPPRAAIWPASTWSGLHVGVHAGGFGATTSFSDPNGPALYGGFVETPGFAAGLQLGYDWTVGRQWLLGVEASVSTLSGDSHNTCQQATTYFIGSNCKVGPRELATLTGRLGVVTGPQHRTLLYGKGGLAYLRSEISINPNNAFGNLAGTTLSGQPTQGDPTIRSAALWGWTIGGGLEHALTPRWSAVFDYSYMHFDGLALPTPESTNVNTVGAVANQGGGVSGVSQNVQLFKIGLNYRFGGRATADEEGQGGLYDGHGARRDARAPWTPSWEFDVGGRYWYSSGKYQIVNGSGNELLSRLTYDRLAGHAGELFGRVDTPIDFFVKGLVGGGFVSSGRMFDEDWGLSGVGEPAVAYEVTQSAVSGSFNYLTADLGYNLSRGPDHKFGLFAGYNRYQMVLSAFGCTQLVNPASEVCTTPTPGNINVISQIDTWHSLRIGASAELQVLDRVRIAGDLAWLPYVYVDALDIHHLRQPPMYSPLAGNGRGVQAELILTWQATEHLSLGVGARYWAMWTKTAAVAGLTADGFNMNTERYGIFLQGSYRFRPG